MTITALAGAGKKSYPKTDGARLPSRWGVGLVIREFHGRFGRGMSWLLICAQMLCGVATAAPGDDLPELDPAEKAILEFYLKRKPPKVFRGPSLVALAGIPELGRTEVDPSQAYVLSRLIADLAGTTPDKLIQHHPELAEYIERGRALRVAHYGEVQTAAEKLLNDLGVQRQPVDVMENNLLLQIKLMRKYREVKLKEFEAASLAREATRRRTKIDPETARQLLESRAELTVLERDLMSRSTKLHSFLTEYYKDETKLTLKLELPAEALRIWREQVKALLAKQLQDLDVLDHKIRRLNHGAMDGFKDPLPEINIPKVLQGKDGAAHLEFHLMMQRSLVQKMREIALAEEVKDVDGAMRAIAKLKDYQAEIEKLVARCIRGLQKDEIKTPTNKTPEWLNALAWWHEATRGTPAPPHYYDQAGLKAQAEDLAAVKALLGMEEKKPVEKPGRAGVPRTSSVLKWGAAGLLALGLGWGTREALRHSGIELPSLGIFETEGAGTNAGEGNPFSGTRSSLIFSERAHRAGNYGMAARGESQELYRVTLGTAKNLEDVPEAFEFAFLEERNKPKEVYTFERGDRKAEFSLKSKVGIRPSNGWFSVARTPGHDTEVVLTSNGKTLVEGVDYKVWKTETGTLLVHLLKDKSPAGLEAQTSHYKATKTNPPPASSLEMTGPELDKLIAQTRLMEKEGMTEVARQLRERAEAAKRGGRMLVTDIARIVHGANYYSEIDGPKVTDAKGWEKFRNIPREGGSLVMQCSVANEFVLTLARLVFDRPEFEFHNVHVYMRDPASPSLTVGGSHVYPVLKVGAYDSVSVDGTPGRVHPLYARQPAGTGRPWYQNPWVHGAVGVGLGALGVGWYLGRRRNWLKDTLDAREEEEKKEEAKRREKEKADDKEPAKERVLDPRTADLQDLAVQRRNAERRRLLAELRRHEQKLFQYAEAFGVEAGKERNRSFPLPSAAEAMAVLRDFVEGNTTYASRKEVMERLARAFLLGDADVARANGSLRALLGIAREEIKSNIAKFRELRPKDKNLARIEANTMQALDAMLEFASRQAWTPMEPLPSKVAAAEKANGCLDISAKF